MLNTGPHSCIGGASNYLAPALVASVNRLLLYTFQYYRAMRLSASGIKIIIIVLTLGILTAEGIKIIVMTIKTKQKNLKKNNNKR